jgi:CrcB protein
VIAPWLFLAVALAGGVGAALRLVVDGVLRAAVSTRLPLATAVINVGGSFVLGLLTGLAASSAVAPGGLLVLGGGLMGGYTTFSTASVETVRLLAERRFGPALGYGLGVLVLAVAAGVLGVVLGSA